MRDHLPVNGAGACGLADPADALPVVLGQCSGPGCKQLVYTGDEEAWYDDLTGEYFCCAQCHTEAQHKRGGLTRVSEMGAE
jgi:hypothetical protein